MQTIIGTISVMPPTAEDIPQIMKSPNILLITSEVGTTGHDEHMPSAVEVLEMLLWMSIVYGDLQKLDVRDSGGK